ncbi:hypothetical protein [Rhizobium rhizoryzae]|nr:hypothetical protein [Rhizobium rhizoryzae]
MKHSNGIREQLIGGRYVMRDRNGRTIINRPAAARDVYRFQHLDR